MIHRHLLRNRLRHQKRLREAALQPRGQAKLQRSLSRTREQTGVRNLQDQKVVILGAGIAGLTCGYELAKLGVEVVLLEAEQQHIGGRVRTHRRGGGGPYAELGAMRIPESHGLTNGYITEFGLQTRPFVMSNDEAFTYIRKTSFKTGDISGSNESRAMDLFELSAEEREMGYGGMWEAAVLDVLDSLSPDQVDQLYADDMTDPTVIGLDHKALATALRDANLSREASEYVMTMMGLETALPIALTEHLREEHDEVWLGNFHEIVGGTDLLATSFYDALETLQPGKVKQGCEVIRLEQTGTKARAIYTSGGSTFTEEGDWVICTIPLGVLNRLDIHSAFSNQRLRAIQGVNYDPSTKVIGYSAHRWWESVDGIYGGGSMYDTQMGSTWYPADNTAQDPEITNAESLFLASYTWGQLARRIATIPPDQLDDVMRHELGHIHSAIQGDPSLYTTEIRWAWDQVPTQAGAYAFFMPGEQYRFYQDMVGPDGRIFLTGEHVSHTHSWIQGALESAIETLEYITTAGT